MSGGRWTAPSDLDYQDQPWYQREATRLCANCRREYLEDVTLVIPRCPSCREQDRQEDEQRARKEAV